MAKLTALHYCCACGGRVELMKLLLDHGANPELLDEMDKKPIDYAVEKGRTIEIEVLKKFKEEHPDDIINTKNIKKPQGNKRISTSDNTASVNPPIRSIRLSTSDTVPMPKRTSRPLSATYQGVPSPSIKEPELSELDWELLREKSSSNISKIKEKRESKKLKFGEKKKSSTARKKISHKSSKEDKMKMKGSKSADYKKKKSKREKPPFFRTTSAKATVTTRTKKRSRSEYTRRTKKISKENVKPSSECVELKNFLESIGLSSCYPKFRSQEVTYKDLVVLLSDDEKEMIEFLESLGILKGPAIRIKHKLKKKTSQTQKQSTRQKESDKVREWLKKNNLDMYADALISAGYDDFSVITILTQKELIEIGISKPGHRKKFLMCAREYEAKQSKD
eukprot:CAMPEP_0174261076 /NCGR_PEP_ID=MMETSP0439-20130205/11216_1 /TAXON_ID=0 /ORGANISM="Stereomyxa ramosa, Strain Chinc5" /LENGTH=392 /DNA_ID=CAMNT_0015345493 /DNA_START=130 /DNA_END=1305 /DNA_ORIENTATION=-